MTRDQVLLEGDVASQVGNPGFPDTATGGGRQIFTDAHNGGVTRVESPAPATSEAPVGRSGQQVNFPNPSAPKPRNQPEIIDGRDFSGHAIDRMQERGFTPSVIENAIRNGEVTAGNRPNTSVFTDTVNNIRVITNTETGRVITIIPGSNR